jgi:predicted dehydrogenase
MTEDAPVRIGVLGAAQIAPMALIKPAAGVAGVRIAAVAARDPARARQFAQKHGIARVHPTYAELLADVELDAIYNPLPNSLHCEWSIRALEAGKHVLCEKPMAANADEAQQMADAARRTGRLLVEAFHYRYHPLAARVRSIVDSGVLGPIRHVEAHMCIPLPIPGNIRYRYDLAGGATMDTGCYAISLVRFLAGAEPEVVRATARLSSPQVDRCMTAELRFADGRTGRITCSLFSASLLRVSARVRGDTGELTVLNPFAPQFPHRIRIRTRTGTAVERVPSEPTYTHQLRAFVAAVRGGPPMATDPIDAIANMRVIDAVYEKAGLTRRGAARAG